jgi:hypothetical protein
MSDVIVLSATHLYLYYFDRTNQSNKCTFNIDSQEMKSILLLLKILRRFSACNSDSVTLAMLWKLPSKS